MGGAGEPDGSSVEDYGSDDGFVGDDYCFFLLAPVGASKSFFMLWRGVMRETRLFICGPKVK